MLIAIDGPAASGKGTVARMLAKHFNLEYLDTGKLYRAVGFILADSGLDLKKADANEVALKAQPLILQINEETLNNQELETEIIGAYASIVSAIPQVRDSLVSYQRKVASSQKGAVLDGRDIGTVICPNADYKFFITADAKIRANRRYKQLQERKKDVNEALILRDIVERDKRDSERSIAPLKPSEDAETIVTDNISPSEVFDKIKFFIEKTTN